MCGTSSLWLSLVHAILCAWLARGPSPGRISIACPVIRTSTSILRRTLQLNRPRPLHPRIARRLCPPCTTAIMQAYSRAVRQLLALRQTLKAAGKPDAAVPQHPTLPRSMLQDVVHACKAVVTEREIAKGDPGCDLHFHFHFSTCIFQAKVPTGACGTIGYHLVPLGTT